MRRRLMDDRPDRKLELCAVADATDDRHRRTIGAPVRADDIGIQLARCAACECRHGERAVRLPAIDGRPRRRDGELTLFRQGEQIGRSEVHGSRLRGADAGRVEAIRLAIPRGAVNHALPIGGKARLADVAVAERELGHDADRRRREHPAREITSRRHGDRETGGQQRHAPDAAGARRAGPAWRWAAVTSASSISSRASAMS